MTVSKSQIKATTKWEKKKYDKILVRLPKGTKEQLHEKADQAKISLNKYIQNLLLQQVQKESEEVEFHHDGIKYRKINF